jgi:hypothetical protein
MKWFWPALMVAVFLIVDHLYADGKVLTSCLGSFDGSGCQSCTGLTISYGRCEDRSHKTDGYERNVVGARWAGHISDPPPRFSTLI